MAGLSGEFLRAALDAAPQGIVICEAHPPDHTVVYANPAFLRLTGYSADELLGQDLRLLQGPERDQQGRAAVRAALARGEGCRVLLRNYRKDGTQFLHELQVQPLRSGAAGDTRGGRGGGGAVTHFISMHREVDERERGSPRSATGLASWLREDRLSGLYSRAYFEELLQRDWQIGVRESRVLTLLAFDIDELGSYNDTYGRAAGDACIRRVAGVIGASFRRGSDVVARWDGGCIIGLIRNSDPEAVPAFASSVAQKVLGQHIHHPRAQRQKFVSVSVGAASLHPSAERSPDGLIQAVMRALERAKRDRAQRVVVAGPAEIN